MQAPTPEIAEAQLTGAVTDVSEIVFFLLGAMTIVEIIDAHQGFKIVTDSITTRKPRVLLWVVGLFSPSVSYTSCDALIVHILFLNGICCVSTREV